jgi:cell division protein FtsL
MSIVDVPERTYRTRGGVALAPAPTRRPNPRPTPARAPEANPRHLRVVAPAERVRRRLTPATGVLLTGLLFATLFLVAIAHTVLVQGQIRLDDLDAQLTVEQARYQALRTEVAEMESPARVVAAAQELGMVAPQDLVYLQPDAPHPAGDPADAPDSAGTGGDDPVSGADNTWAVMKPLLETPAP